MPLTTETFYIVEVRPNEYWAGQVLGHWYNNDECIEQTTTSRLNLATSIRRHEWMEANLLIPGDKSMKPGERWNNLMLKTYPNARVVEVKATYTV